MDIRGELRYRSLYWYNDGLKKAKIRDLTGALASLKKSIRFDKYNKDARNLLGLVYYGRGEVPRAMAVWIVSERLNPRENVATEYLKSCRESKKLAGYCGSSCQEVQPVFTVLQARGRGSRHYSVKEDRVRTAGFPAGIPAFSPFVSAYFTVRKKLGRC